MIDMQQFLVAEHIAELDSEAAALRAERELDRDGADHSDGPASRRVRFGHWLVGVGRAIAGDEDTRSLPNAA